MDPFKIVIGPSLKGKCHGYGILYDQHEQRLYAGYFFNGLYHGDGCLYYPSGNIYYRGTFIHGKKHGKGVEYEDLPGLIVIREGIYIQDEYQSIQDVQDVREPYILFSKERNQE